MNGELLREVKEIFNDIVMPHIENIKEDVTDIKDKIEKVTNSVSTNQTTIEVNKTNIDNIHKNFRNNIILTGVILAAISILTNIVIAMASK